MLALTLAPEAVNPSIRSLPPSCLSVTHSPRRIVHKLRCVSTVSPKLCGATCSALANLYETPWASISCRLGVLMEQLSHGLGDGFTRTKRMASPMGFFGGLLIWVDLSERGSGMRVGRRLKLVELRGANGARWVGHTTEPVRPDVPFCITTRYDVIRDTGHSSHDPLDAHLKHLSGRALDVSVPSSSRVSVLNTQRADAVGSTVTGAAVETVLTLAPFEVPGSSASTLLLGDHGYKKPDTNDSGTEKEEEDDYSSMLIDTSPKPTPSMLMNGSYGLRRPDAGATGSAELWKKLMAQDTSSDVVKTRALVTGTA